MMICMTVKRMMVKGIMMKNERTRSYFRAGSAPPCGEVQGWVSKGDVTEIRYRMSGVGVVGMVVGFRDIAESGRMVCYRHTTWRMAWIRPGKGGLGIVYILERCGLRWKSHCEMGQRKT